ncbi:recombinase family protein [Lactiplantibacillus pentosus]|uniref:recombinase family protein n=1 Tax=Lactiplantibacillus pentosus TaxID=1589 RepID=UPI00271062B1|nr:recombinase family protein [Lactiplantibacillus pentosus]MDO7806527.1 recombinase family protein [Lactiplantibacillus pentosus]
MTINYGYARVSTAGQDLKEQQSELLKAGVQEANLFSEKFTGTTINRPQFNKLLAIVKAGDIITVTKLDRFARNTKEALEAIEPLLDKDVTIKVLNLGTIENTTMGKMILRTLLSVAEMERDMIVERTQAGKAYAKAHKKNYREGRPQRVITPQYQAIYDYLQDHTYKQTATAFKVGTATVSRIKKQIESNS